MWLYVLKVFFILLNLLLVLMLVGYSLKALNRARHGDFRQT